MFEPKWRARPSGTLPAAAFTVGKAIVDNLNWVQDELSAAPHTVCHGDVKPLNMFMMPNGEPAFIDWQYTAVGKGVQDIVFFLIEGYDTNECRRLEPLVMEQYHKALCDEGVENYSMDDLRRDWKLACSKACSSGRRSSSSPHHCKAGPAVGKASSTAAVL